MEQATRQRKRRRSPWRDSGAWRRLYNIKANPDECSSTRAAFRKCSGGVPPLLSEYDLHNAGRIQVFILPLYFSDILLYHFQAVEDSLTTQTSKTGINFANLNPPVLDTRSLARSTPAAEESPMWVQLAGCCSLFACRCWATNMQSGRSFIRPAKTRSESAESCSFFDQKPGLKSETSSSCQPKLLLVL